MKKLEFLKQNKKGILVIAALLIVARISSILYSFFATNSSTNKLIIVDILYYVYNSLSALLIPSLVAFVLINLYDYKSKSSPVLSTVFLFIFVDRALCVIYDAVTVGLSGQVMAAILFNIAITIHSFILVLFTYFVIKNYSYKYDSPRATSLIKKKYSKLNALIISYGVIFIASLLRSLVNIFSFLIEYNFNVYPQEVASMIEEILFVVLTRAVIPAVVGIVVLKPFKKSKPEIVENQ